MSLRDLVVNTDEIEEAALEKLAVTYFKYDQQGGVLIFNKEFWSLSGDKKIAFWLTALMGRKFLGLTNPETGATNDSLVKSLNMNYNSVRSYLSQLRKRGALVTDTGVHRITTQGIHDLMEEEHG